MENNKSLAMEFDFKNQCKCHEEKHEEDYICPNGCWTEASDKRALKLALENPEKYLHPKFDMESSNYKIVRGWFKYFEEKRVRK